MTKEERLIKQKERFAEMTRIEGELRAEGAVYIAGVDEVGRGPLAGPVYAACVVLPADFDVLGVDDSKRLSEKKRDELDAVIRERAVAYGIGIASSREIDEVNILNATKLAMEKAVASVRGQLRESRGADIDILMIDALRLENVDVRQEALVHGDARSISIAAASIVAKVARDSYMKEMDAVYPGYGFAGNKGYGTAAHYEGIRNLGITPIHRRSFLRNMETKHGGREAGSMAGKKIYAVRAGRRTGIFESWDECRAQVDGYRGAEYKSFGSREDALSYLGLQEESLADAHAPRAYVDGSYDAATGRYACGVVLIKDGEVTELSEAFDDSSAARLRNVAGEIMGARRAVEYAASHGFSEIDIYYDYAGIGKWGDDEWKANLEMTRDYKAFVAEAREKLAIRFVKVKGHSGDTYNDRADRLAKDAIGIK